MKKKITLLLILLILINSVSVYADCSLLQSAVIAAPGSSPSDWSAIALSVSGNDFDKNAYITLLNEYVQNKYLTNSKLSATKATEWHRIAIAINLLGYDASDFYGINLINDGVYYRENIGRQGLNGYIWGLIAISSGSYTEPSDALNTKESIISTILSEQNPDGSYSLSGGEPSCDITAMAIYALSFYKDRSLVSVAIDNALNYLSSVQNPDGSFSDGGVPNAESTSQVIIALASTGADPKSDLRFPNLYNALKSFEIPGGFCHLQGGEADTIATYQAYCALAASKKKSAIYSNYFTTQILAEQPTEVETQAVYIPIKAPAEVKIEVIEEVETEVESAVFTEVETEIATDDTQIIPTDEANVAKNSYSGKGYYLFLIIIPFVFIAIYVIIRRKQ